MPHGAIKSGLPDDLANHSDGFVASGVGEYTRHSAKSPTISLTKGRRTDGRLLREVERDLRKLEYQARIEREPVRLARILKDVEIKRGFLAKVRKSFDAHPTKPKSLARTSKTWDWEEVETLPGADEYTPWPKS